MEKRKKIDIAPIVDLGSNSPFWLFEYENNKTCCKSSRMGKAAPSKDKSIEVVALPST